VVSEIPLSILSAALRVALTRRPAFVSIDLETDLGAQRQHQNLTGGVALRWPMKVYSPAVVGVPQKTTSPTL
jgi:thiamine pyrophosphate-dependent acetolactate synthase large subunit-like protein